MDIQEESLRVHEMLKGKLEIKSKMPLNTRKDLSLAYTPGVAEPCRHIAKNKDDVYKYTIKSNSVAVVSDGSAVLGLGNIGGEAAIPVMEGKALLFKEFAGIDAFPICLSFQDINRTIETVKNISPVFGGINLEDFKAPECFEIEQALQDIGIPVMHDDQHGTAVVVLAALINSLKVTGKDMKSVSLVINGAGAAGTAITKLIIKYGFDPGKIILCDTKGAILLGRPDLLGNKHKEELASITNKHGLQGSLKDVIKSRDIFIGVSAKNVLTKEMVSSMSSKPIVMAMANPDPEIMPQDAREAGALVVATGRSDFPNQVNNALAFPGIFRGALDVRATKITDSMKIAAAEALSSLIKNPTADEILPPVTDRSVAPAIAEAVKNAWLKNKA